MLGGSPVPLPRRTFLAYAAAAAGIPLAGLLSSCAHEPTYPHAADLRFPSPEHPVTWKRYPENPPIASELPVEEDASLRIYTWDGYVAPQVLKDFQSDYGVGIELSTFYDMTEAISKLRAGAVRPDVFFPTLDVLGRLVVATMLQPLNRDYLTNFGDIWPQLRHPFYDAGSDYTVPYAVYSTGIAWRNDLVPASIPELDDPWSVFGDTTYAGQIFVLDDYREAIAMVLQAEGVRDLNTEDGALIQHASERLSDLGNSVGLKWSLDDYTLVPEGRAYIHQAWSGDMVTSPAYGSGTPDEVAPTISFWFPTDGTGEVNNDMMAIPRTAEHPVLAHVFINYLMDEQHALDNFSWVGYQQPLQTLTRDQVIGVYPWLGQPNMAAALVTQEDMQNGFRQLELSTTGDAAWEMAWARFKSGS